MSAKVITGQYKERRNFVKRFFRPKKPSPFLFSNEKTFGISIDTGFCQMKCPKCYSKVLFACRPQIKESVQRAHVTRVTPHQCKIFEQSLCQIKTEGHIHYLRFFSFGDFHTKAIPLVEIASDIGFRCSLISKCLHFPRYRQYIGDLAKLPNVFVSFSFNNLFGEDYILGFLKQTKWSNRFQNHWTFVDTPASKKQIEFYRHFHKTNTLPFHVYHTTAKNKTKLSEVVGKSKTCCLSGVCDDCRVCYRRSE